MVKFSPAAIAELHRWGRSRATAEAGQGWTVILEKITGSCHPWAYNLRLSPISPKTDSSQAAIPLDDGLQLLVSGPDQSWCDQLTIDYAEDLIGGGFRFINPKATQTCSCGVSFDLN